MTEPTQVLDLVQVVQDNWQFAFLYGLKYLKGIDDNLRDLKTIVKTHEIEIENLKKQTE